MRRCSLACCVSMRDARALPVELPSWAVRKPSRSRRVLELVAAMLDECSTYLVRCSDRLLGIQPREALSRVPRLLAVGGVRPTVMDNCFIAPSALLCGDVRVGRKNYIGYNATLRADDGEAVVLGESCNVQEKAIVMGNTTIGKWSSIEPMAVIDSADVASCSYVGAGAVMLRGSCVESGAMLCAASVLQSGAVVPSGEVWSGNPAQKIGVLTESAREQMIKAAKHMVLLAVEHHDAWQLTWDEIDNHRQAREMFSDMTEHNREVRVDAMYVKEPPRGNPRRASQWSPHEYVGRSEDPSAEISGIT